MTILLILAIIFFIILAYLRLDLAILAIIMLLPSYLLRFSILSVPVTFLEIMILSSFAVWFIKTTKLKPVAWLRGRKERLKYPFRYEIIAVLILSLLAVIVAGISDSALGIWKAYFFEPVILYILILNVLPKKEGRKKIIIALSISALLTSLFAITQKITGLFIFNPFWLNPESRRVVAWFGYPNAVGLYLAPIVMLISGYLIKTWKNRSKKINWESLLYITTIILSILAIIFARSEGALVALLASSLVFLFFISKKSRIISIAIIILGLISIIISPQLSSLAKDKLTLSDLSGEIRKQQWRETMQTLKGESFLLGNGLANYQTAVSPYHQEGIFFNRDKMENFHSILYGNAELREKYWQPVEIYMYPHNIFLNFWSELGLLGALIFTWLMIKFLVHTLINSKAQEKYLSLGLFSAMLAIIIHGLVDVPYFKNDLSALFFILLALLASMELDVEIKNKLIEKGLSEKQDMLEKMEKLETKE